MKAITILDEPCGTGKTSRMISSLNPAKNYLIVVPYLSEVQRIIKNAKQMNLFQPEAKFVSEQSKHSHLRQLLKDKKSIVTTHSLYEDAVSLAREGLLQDYQIIIDEVLNAAEIITSKSFKSLNDFYFQTDYLTADEEGIVSTSWNWLKNSDQVRDTLDTRIFKAANSGKLFLEGGQNFITGLPRELLSAGQSVTIMTFMFEGSLLRAYLEKIGIKYELQRNKKAELCFRKQANELINIKTIPSLEKLSLCHSGQAQGLKIRSYQKSFNNGLRNLRQRNLANIPNDDILITTRKDIWFKNGDKELNKAGPCAKSSRLFNANWIANTTRGTNDYSHCSTLLYIYDQHVNPTIARWLGVAAGKFSEQYALTELIQWVWRSRIRNGKPIILYLPSNRMRRILQSYLRLQ